MRLLPEMSRGRLRAIVACAVVAALAMLGVSAAAVAAPAKKAPASAKDSLVVLEEEIAPSLDLDGPSGAQPQTQEIIDNLMDPLVTYKTTLKNGILVPNYNISQTQFLPRLAESYTKNGLVFTFKLRKNVKSCAGNTLTADDVIYTFQRAKSVSGAAPIAWFLSNTSGILGLEVFAKVPDKVLKKEVVKIDDSTVQFTQMAPNELFPRVLSIFALYIFDSKEMKARATAKDPWSHDHTGKVNAPGFGAYCLKSWTKGSEMVLTANPDYYLGQPQFKTVTIRKVPTLANRVAAIKSGAADLMYPLTPTVLSDIAGQEKTDVLGWFNNNTVSIGLNYKVAPFGAPGNQYLRQAIAYALPYNDIITQDFKGQARKWNGLIQSIYYGYVADARYKLDIAKAKALLVKAGYPGGKGLEKFQSAFTLYYVSERSAVLEPVANRIATALKAIGINLKLAPVTSVEMNTRELTKFDLPMWIRDQLQPIGTDVGYSVGVFYASKAAGGIVPSTNYTGVDKDYAAQGKVAGPARVTILKRMQATMMNDLPLIPILEYPTWLAVRKGITHMEGRPNNSITYYWFKSA